MIKDLDFSGSLDDFYRCTIKSGILKYSRRVLITLYSDIDKNWGKINFKEHKTPLVLLCAVVSNNYCDQRFFKSLVQTFPT